MTESTADPLTGAEAPGRVPISGLHSIVATDGPRAILRLGGALRLEDVWRFGAELSHLIRAGHRHLTVDMRDLADIAPVCVGVLNRAVGELVRADGSLSLRGVNAATSTILRRAGLHPAIRTTSRQLDVI